MHKNLLQKTAGLAAALVVFSCASVFAEPVDLARERLDKFADYVAERQTKDIGYPLNHNIQLEGFYKWLTDRGIYKVMIDNAGDPYHIHGGYMNALEFEREVIETFGPHYGFDTKDVWGLVSFSGTVCLAIFDQ